MHAHVPSIFCRCDKQKYKPISLFSYVFGKIFCKAFNLYIDNDVRNWVFTQKKMRCLWCAYSTSPCFAHQTVRILSRSSSTDEHGCRVTLRSLNQSNRYNARPITLKRRLLCCTRRNMICGPHLTRLGNFSGFFLVCRGSGLKLLHSNDK